LLGVICHHYRVARGQSSWPAPALRSSIAIEDLMTTPLLSLPISFVTALIALALLVVVARSAAGSAASRVCFALLFGLFFVQAVLVGVRFGYGLDALARYQRVLPFAIGPLAYLGFRAMAEPRGRRGGPAGLHLAVALIAIAACWALPSVFNLIDLLIASSFMVYIGLLVGLYRRGPDAFEATAFSAIPGARAWLLATILLLTGILLVDSAIAADITFFGGRLASGLIALGNGLVIPFLLAAVVLYPRRNERQPAASGAGEPARPSGPPADPEADRALLDRIDALLASRRLHRDPDLSLARLARRLGVPARRVSEAVNRELGLNVSQFVNNHRVAEATALLVASDRPVAEIMLEVGIRTKSNFFREFRRVQGCSPSDYRRRRVASGGASAARTS
jgi:AraC-like DNA-binding protein